MRGERGSIKGHGVRPGGAIAPLFLWGGGRGEQGVTMGYGPPRNQGVGEGFIKG
jgi:hypothetical protein